MSDAHMTSTNRVLVVDDDMLLIGEYVRCLGDDFEPDSAVTTLGDLEKVLFGVLQQLALFDRSPLHLLHRLWKRPSLGPLPGCLFLASMCKAHMFGRCWCYVGFQEVFRTTLQFALFCRLLSA